MKYCNNLQEKIKFNSLKILDIERARDREIK
jgi:hypothetical protein